MKEPRVKKHPYFSMMYVHPLLRLVRAILTTFCLAETGPTCIISVTYVSSSKPGCWLNLTYMCSPVHSSNRPLECQRYPEL